MDENKNIDIHMINCDEIDIHYRTIFNNLNSLKKHKVTTINQFRTDTCWAFASMYALDRVAMKKRHIINPLQTLLEMLEIRIGMDSFTTNGYVVDDKEWGYIINRLNVCNNNGDIVLSNQTLIRHGKNKLKQLMDQNYQPMITIAREKCDHVINAQFIENEVILCRDSNDSDKMAEVKINDISNCFIIEGENGINHDNLNMPNRLTVFKVINKLESGEISEYRLIKAKCKWRKGCWISAPNLSSDAIIERSLKNAKNIQNRFKNKNMRALINERFKNIVDEIVQKLKGLSTTQGYGSSLTITNDEEILTDIE